MQLEEQQHGGDGKERPSPGKQKRSLSLYPLDPLDPLDYKPPFGTIGVPRDQWLVFLIARAAKMESALPSAAM